MLLSDLTSRAIKTAFVLVGAIIADYAFLNGRMTRQGVTGLERMLADLPLLFERLMSPLNL